MGLSFKMFNMLISHFQIFHGVFEVLNFNLLSFRVCNPCYQYCYLVAILEDFFLLDSVRYHDDVMTILKSDWFNLKILMSVRHRKLASPCVHLQYIINAMAILRVMSLQHHCNIRMSLGCPCRSSYFFHVR